MSKENPFLSIDQKIVGDVYTSTEPMDNLTMLCDEFGSRFSGTEGERQAVEFMKTKLETYGLSQVHLEPFEYTGWKRGDVKFEITQPVQIEIPCISLPHSPPAKLEGTIIDMGDGAPRDFDRRADEIKGKLVMTNSMVSPKGSKRWIHRGEKYGRSLMAGATGFIFINHYPGYGPATGGIGYKGESLIPGISVSYEDGAFIQRLVKRHGEVKVRLFSSDKCEPMTSWNVVGDLPGNKYPDRIVMIGCHYDGHDISQGAGDPASGVVALMEAARVMSKYATPLRCTTRFALWGAEEIGLIGSTAYVDAHTEKLANILFYLNMDAAGSSSNNRDIVLNEWDGLEPLIKNWRNEMALDFSVRQTLMAFSDHFPFFMKGVPTGGIESADRSLAGRGYGHTKYDTLDKVKSDGLREAAALAARIAFRMAGTENWPVTKRSEDEVRTLLDTPTYQEENRHRSKLASFYQKARENRVDPTS